MKVKQLSVFVENKTGRLAAIMEALGANGINISALSLADTTDFGILRMIVDDPEQARSVLKEIGVTVRTTDVLAVEVEDKPGALVRIMNGLSQNGVDVAYMYAFTARNANKALMVLRVSDPDRAETLLN